MAELFGWFAGWLSYWWIDWLFDWMCDGLTDWLLHCLLVCFWLVDWMLDWLIECVIVCMFAGLIDWWIELSALKSCLEETSLAWFVHVGSCFMSFSCLFATFVCLLQLFQLANKEYNATNRIQIKQSMNESVNQWVSQSINYATP